MKSLHMITWILLIVGGINWLLVAILGYDISNFLGGMSSLLAKAIYLLVGLSAIYEIVTHKKNCRACDTGASSPNQPQM